MKEILTLFIGIISSGGLTWFLALRKQKADAHNVGLSNIDKVIDIYIKTTNELTAKVDSQTKLIEQLKEKIDKLEAELHDYRSGKKKPTNPVVSIVILFFLFASTFLSSCVTCKDTVTKVTVRDTIFIPGAKLNTDFDNSLNHPIDLSKGNLRLFIKPVDSAFLKHDTTFVNGLVTVHDTTVITKRFKVNAECLPDTIYKEKSVFVKSKTKIEKRMPWWAYLIIGALVLINLKLVFKIK